MAIVWQGKEVLRMQRGQQYLVNNLRGNAVVQPTSMDVVANKVLALQHLSCIVHNCADLSPNLDFLEGYHQRADGCFPVAALGKQVSKLQTPSELLITVNIAQELLLHAS